MFIFSLYTAKNYGNISWGSAYKTKLKKILTYQKKAARLIFFSDLLAHIKPSMLGMNLLNFYQINTYENLFLLYKTHTGTNRWHSLTLECIKSVHVDPSTRFVMTSFTWKVAESPDSIYSSIFMLESIWYHNFTWSGPNSQETLNFIPV